MSTVHAAAGWLRRQLAWSNSRRSWEERLGFVALVAAAAAGWWVSRDWGAAARILLAALWLVFLAVLLRRGIIKLLGPVFFFELLRGSRKRVHVARTLYAGILLATLVYVYLVSAEGRRSGDPSLRQQAETAATFFAAFVGIQLGVVLLITPMMMAGAIAEDKERRTLEFVLATDLRSREIVLGKLAGRLANMGLLLLAGLPVLSVMQLQGGISPDLLLCALAVLAVTQASVAALSIWQSTLLRRGRDAILMTYLAMFGYVVVSGAAHALLLWDDFTNWSATVAGWRVDGADLVHTFAGGNPVAAAVHIAKHLGVGHGSLMDVVPDLLQRYVAFHTLVFVVGVVWSVARLRPIALGQLFGGVARRVRAGRRLPAVGRRPMMWKELFAESFLRVPFVLRVLAVLIVIATFVPPVLIVNEFADRLIDSPPAANQGMGYPPYYSRDPWDDFGWAMSAWVRAMAGLAGTLTLLVVAARAAAAVTGERGRHTFDDLLTTPLTNAEIINAKWLGSVLGTRPVAVWLGAVFFVGLCTGGLSVVGALLYALAWFAFAGFMASLGLFFSTACRTSLRAMLATVITALIALGGHWIFTGLFCFLPLSVGFDGSDARDLVEWLVAFQAGLTPPFVLGLAPVHALKEFDQIHDREVKELVIGPVFGVVVFLVAGQLLRLAVIRRFARLTGRTTVRVPERTPPAVKAAAAPAKPVTGETAAGL